MTNQSSDRSVVRVQVGSSKAKSGIPRLSSAVVARTQAGDECLSSSGGILSSLAGTTDVGKLIVDAVGNDGRVKSFLLSLVAERVLSLEGEGSGSTPIEPCFELHGWDTEAEVEGGVG